jgi:DNA uptake protein ComE-like DNA-binding protein
MKRFLAVLLAAAVGLGVLGCDVPRDSKAADKPTATESKADAKSTLIDINRAKAEELMTLRGIGEARAKAIVKGRPYARKDEIVQKKIVPQSVYDDIKEQIIARQ